MARSDEIWRVDAGALHGSRSRTPEAQRNYVQSYTYDPVGNILRMKHVSGGVTVWHRGYDYAEDGNRLEKTSLPGDDVEDPGDYSENYTHNAHGSMTAMPSIPGGLTWDPQDRLIETDLSGGGVVYYVYDSAGMRVRKVWVNQSGTTSKERYYLGAWETYRETTDLLGTPTLDLERETLHVNDAAGAACLIETKTAESATPIGSPDSILRYQHHNHLGTATLELTGDAEVISYEEYHPYGTSAYRAANSAVDVSPKRYRYTGKERDEETGLYYHEARYYACVLGRWASADPLGLAAGINRFAYVGGQPVSKFDPTGTTEEFVRPTLITTGRGSGGRGAATYPTENDPQFLTTPKFREVNEPVEQEDIMTPSDLGPVREAIEKRKTDRTVLLPDLHRTQTRKTFDLSISETDANVTVQIRLFGPWFREEEQQQIKGEIEARWNHAAQLYVDGKVYNVNFDIQWTGDSSNAHRRANRKADFDKEIPGVATKHRAGTTWTTVELAPGSRSNSHESVTLSACTISTESSSLSISQGTRFTLTMKKRLKRAHGS